jgi:hypothetical protein
MKRRKIEDPNIAFNSSIFQSLCVVGTEPSVNEALVFAKEVEFSIDNSRLYGVRIMEDTTLYDITLRKIAHNQPLRAELAKLFVKTNMNPNFCGTNAYETIYQSETVSTDLLEYFVNQPDLFPIDHTPCALNIMTRIKSSHLSYKAPQVSRLCKVIQSTKNHKDAYLIFNRFETCKGSQLPAMSPLEISMKGQEVFYVKILLLMLPLVDLDVFRFETNSWWIVEREYGAFFEAPKAHNKSIIISLVNTAREILESYRDQRHDLVLELFHDHVLLKEICDLINSFGVRPQQ